MLDFNSSSSNKQSTYWAINFISNYKESELYFKHSNFIKKHTCGNVFKNFGSYFTNHKKFTIVFSVRSSATNHEINELFIKKDDEIKVDKIKVDKIKVDKISKEYNLAFLYWNKNSSKTSYPKNKQLVSWHELININFIRKERLYTKLKYSRSPAYDSVSGGAAALLAGFIGFLVSEKFGYELGDSGDFYFLFMYLVFLSFSIKPLLFSAYILDDESSIDSFSPKHFFTFYSDLFTIFILRVKSFPY